MFSRLTDSSMPAKTDENRNIGLKWGKKYFYFYYPTTARQWKYCILSKFHTYVLRSPDIKKKVVFENLSGRMYGYVCVGV